MSDMWSAVQWQLRILVLASLGFQWFLVLVVPVRNYTVHRWIRACIRLASICADVLAIYALATVLYRQAAGRWFNGFEDDYSRTQDWRSLPLEALWAPLLLVHLGGREELTASGMDDDTAIWVRHAAVLVTVTVYAFSNSLLSTSDDRDALKLLASEALLLVAAVVSTCGKPWVLRRASVRRLVAKSSLAKGARRRKTKAKDRPSIGRWWEWCFTELGDRYKCWKELRPRGTAPMLSQGDKVQMLLSGMSLHAATATLETRKKKPDQKILEPLKQWRRDEHEALKPQEVDKIMKPCLRQAFGLIYTREAAMFTPAYLACHALLVPSLYVAATVLLFSAVSYKKHGYSRYSSADVNTTYLLLCFTAVLDVLGMFVSEMLHWLLSSSGRASSCENLPGHNLMDSVLWTIRRPIVSKLLLGCYKGGSFDKDKDGLYGRVLDIIRNKVEDKDKDKNKDDRMKDKDTNTNKVKDKDKDDKVEETDAIRNKMKEENKDNKVEDRDINTKIEDKDTNKDKNKDDKVDDKVIIINKVGDKDEDKNKVDKMEDKDINTNKVEDKEKDKDKDDKEDKDKTKDKDKDDKDKDQDKNFNLDLSSYRSLSKRNWILKDEKLRAICTTKANIRDSLRKKPFDASVLVWHIATDLCFRVKSPNYFRFRPSPEGVVREVCTEAISNYMAYLLDFHPEMLMAGSRQHLFTEAMANMEHVVRKATKGLSPKLREKQPLDDILLDKIKKEAASLKDNEAYTVIDDACKLTEELLRGIPEDNTRWELMHRVWVGMLCYSASMCRSDLHAKSLGEGGEFLSNVWLLVSLIGGRTLADKLQMPDEDPEPEDKVAVAPAIDDKGKEKAQPEAGGKVQTPDTSKPKEDKAADFFKRQGMDVGPRKKRGLDAGPGARPWG